MKDTHRLRWLALLFAWLLNGCHAGDAPQGKQDAPHDLIGQSLERALDYSEHVSDFFEGPPRKAPRGAHPELIVENNRITLDGKPLVLEAPVAEWWKVLGPPSRQDRSGRVQVWDALGLGITARLNKETDNALTDLIQQSHNEKNKHGTARIDVEKVWGNMVNKARSDGRFNVSSLWIGLINSPPPDDVNEDGEPWPRQAFSGYVQVNGVGVDAKTSVRDISRGSRNASPPLMFLGCVKGTQSCEASADVSKDGPLMMYSFGVDNSEQRHVTSFRLFCDDCPTPNP